MATFFVLPPREFVGEWFAGYLKTCFPGLDWPRDRLADLSELLSAAVADRDHVYLVHREDLTPECDLAEALADGFGAELGDEVVEVHPASLPGKWMTRRWRLGVQSERLAA